MSVPAATAGGAGCGHLAVKRVAGQSAATSASAVTPLKLLVPQSRGPSVWACLSSFGGGLVAGDEVQFAVRLGEHTRCYLGTQAATKIYRNPGARPCHQHLHATLGAGALLVLAPDPVQPFADSRYGQRQEFHLHAGSALVLVDWLTSGRAACGERWAFTRFQSRNDVFMDGEQLWMDSLLLDAAAGELAAPARMGRFNCLALLAVMGAPLAGAAAQLLAEVAATPIGRRAPLILSASPIRQGALLRLAGEHVEEVTREIRRRLAFLGEWLGGQPWERKG